MSINPPLGSPTGLPTLPTVWTPYAVLLVLVAIVVGRVTPAEHLAHQVAQVVLELGVLYGVASPGLRRQAAQALAAGGKALALLACVGALLAAPPSQAAPLDAPLAEAPAQLVPLFPPTPGECTRWDSQGRTWRRVQQGATLAAGLGAVTAGVLGLYTEEAKAGAWTALGAAVLGGLSLWAGSTSEEYREIHLTRCLVLASSP